MKSITSYCLQTDANHISTRVTKASVIFNMMIIVYLIISVCSYWLLQCSSALAVDFFLKPYLLVSLQVRLQASTLAYRILCTLFAVL